MQRNTTLHRNRQTQTDNASALESNPQRRPEYRKPRLVEIGSAVQLVRNNISGHIRDYSGSWYVWGS